ncbi:MAG: hypothetical protein NC394_09370 [Bacteroides sp.]|nr:hypothetical protein [Bacteroides sp.]
MNGYEKMKRLRRMKITKAISAVTALSMTVTGLVVAASANSADPDYLSKALGGLTDFGIVARDMTVTSDFESNFAVSTVNLGNSFNVNQFVSTKSRTVTFNVTSNETFEAGEQKFHYLGIYRNNDGVGELIDVNLSGETDEAENAEENPRIIAVKFTKAGTQSFSITIPDEYKYDKLTVHKLDLVVNEGDEVGHFEIADNGTTLLPFSSNVSAAREEAVNIIAESLVASDEAFASNKTVYVGPEIYPYLEIKQDGRIFYGHNPELQWIKPEGSDYYEAVPVYDENGNQKFKSTDGAPIANNTNKFYLMENAPEVVNGLIDRMQIASDELALINAQSVTDKVKYVDIDGSVYSDTDDATEILDAYEFIKNNPDWSLLVNIKLHSGENTFVLNDRGNGIGDRDLDSSSRIVFNFIGGDVDSTHVTLGAGLRGTMLIPNARASIVSNVCGAVYAPQLVVKSGELHMAPYRSYGQDYWAEYFDSVQITTTTTAETTTEATTPEETTTEETTTEATTPEVTTPEETTTEATTPEETTTEATTPEETTTEATTPEVTTPEETTTEATTPEETTTEATTPEVTTPEETTTEATTPEVTTPEETTTEATTPEETTTEATTPEETELETTPEETVPEETTPEEETTPVETTRPHFVVPETTTTTTVPETTTEETTTPAETTTVETNIETTTVPPVETTTEEETTTEPPHFETPETTAAVTTVEVFSDEAVTTTAPPHFVVPETTTAPASETTVPPMTTTAPPVTEEIVTTEATVTVPVTVRIEEDVPRGTATPDVPIIMIDERVPLSDRPMNTGVESKVGMFAAIGGAALLVGVGAQVYSVILKKKH